MTAPAASPPGDRLMVRYEAIVTTTVVEHLDLVREFGGMLESDRARYWALDQYDFDNAGCEHEWQRPIVWLLETDAMRWHLPSSSHSRDVDDETLNVAPGSSLKPGEWHEAAYDALCAMVGWLKPRSDVTDADLARIPGPADVPLTLGDR